VADGDPVRAAEDFRRALALDPYHAAAKRNLDAFSPR
jgi:hypothetical protein